MAELEWPARGAGGADAWQETTQTGPRGRRVGRHVWLDIEEDGILLIGESDPLFKRKISRYFFRVGLCSHTVYLAGDVDVWRASDLTADGYDRVDPSPRDHRSKHVRKKIA